MPSRPPGRRVFVAGAQGQVARALAEAGAARGDTVLCAGRATLDIADPTATAERIAAWRPDLVVNAAAYTAVDRAEDEPEQAFRVNRDGAGHVAAAAAAAGAPLIHLSTDYVYDGAKRGAYVETDPTGPLGVYGASKLAGEAAVAAAAPRHVILRTSWVCSPHGSNFVRTMLRLAEQRDEIGVVDDQWGAPTFAADLAAAIGRIGDRLLDEPGTASRSGVYHAANAGETTWCRFAEAILAGSAGLRTRPCRIRPITTAQYPTRARRPANSRLDCGKLERAFGIVLADWRSALAGCLARLAPADAGVPA